MDDIKCPACGGVAKLGINQQIGKFYYCLDCNITSTQKPWQELIKIKEQLEFVKTVFGKLYMADVITDEQLEKIKQGLIKGGKSGI